jgi:hypothetical protein
MRQFSWRTEYTLFSCYDTVKKIGILVTIYCGLCISLLYNTDEGKILINSISSTKIIGVPYSGLIVAGLSLFAGLITFIAIVYLVKLAMDLGKRLFKHCCQLMDNFLKDKYNPKSKIAFEDLMEDEKTLLGSLLEYEQNKTTHTVDAPTLNYFCNRTDLDINRIERAAISLDKKNVIQIHGDSWGPNNTIYTAYPSEHRALFQKINEIRREQTRGKSKD